MNKPALVVENLRTQFVSRAGISKAVDGVSFSLARGEIMGLVGESGSGKSMTGYSIMGLIEPPGRIVGGSVRLNGQELVGLPDDSMRAIRGNRIAMIFQDPMMTLNPLLRIDTQMMEAVYAHQNVSAHIARKMAHDALLRVGIPAPEERLLAYPHQFSGGMRQRVAIAIALLNKPDLIICDEPTTALDVTIQAQILYEMQTLCKQSGTALIWITHDLSVVAGLADSVAVMYAGKIVEKGPVAAVISRPRHPYTHGLLECVPSRAMRGHPLKQIPGSAAPSSALPSGCAFRYRCDRASDMCASPPQVVASEASELRCFHPLAEMAEEAR